MIRNNQKIMWLVAVFLFPMVISWVLFHFHAHFNFKTTNLGVLVNPPLDVGYLFSQKESEPHWRVVYLYGNGCDAQCEDIMNVMRQMQKALGKNATRVQLVFLGGPVSSAQVKKLQDNFPNKNFIASQKIYLVDPLNNLFMYYPSTTNMMNVLKDLKKVLEVSQIG